MAEKETILIVDDDEGTRRTLSLILQQVGYRTETVATGQEALAKAGQHFFNAILLDIKLPDIEGIELLTPLRTLRPDTAVILATAYASVETAVQALNEGAAAYITKPLNMDEALVTLRQAIERQRLELENRKLLETIQRELAERKQTEETLRRSLERESALLALSDVVGSTLDLGEVIGAILDQLNQLVEFDSASFQLLDGDSLHTVATLGFEDQPQAQSLTYPLDRFPLNRELIEKGRPIRIDNVQTDERFMVVPGAARIRAFLGVPVLVKGEPVGLITLDGCHPAQFSERDEELAMAVATHTAVAIETARLFQQVREGREQLRDLAGYLQSAREEERTRIAREIHDEFGQALTALRIDMVWLSKRLPPGQLDLAKKTTDMLALIDTTIQMVRRIATELRPGLLDDLGLAAALEWQTQEFSERTGIECDLRLSDEDLVLERDLSTTVFRIFQETLTNVVRHAKATQVQVDLEAKFDELILVVQDNGRGISEDQISDATSLGLIGIRERARAWGGRVTFRGVAGRGTTVTVRVPRHRADQSSPSPLSFRSKNEICQRILRSG